MMSRSRLLQLAIPLVKTHGFTREALSASVLHLPTPHAQPLSESATSALFGNGNDARRTLIDAWRDDARQSMHTSNSSNIKDILRSRLSHNVPVLHHLPEAYALLSTSSALPPLNPEPIMQHAAKVADEACHILGDTSVGLDWYTRRASIAAIYAAAELHQFTSPQSAIGFLGDLLDTSSHVGTAVADVNTFAQYILRSWAGIIKSRGLL